MNKNLIVLSGVIGIAILIGSTNAAADDQPVKIPTEKARQFDFWVGDWKVENKHLRTNGQWRPGGIANARIRHALDGRVIVEQWRGTDSLALRGFSFRIYDTEQKRWEIILNWHSGSPSSFSLMAGNFDESKGAFFPPAKSTPRFTFSKAKTESCQWDQATSANGRDYTTNWIMSFSRTGPSQSIDSSSLDIEAPDPSILKQFPANRQLDRLIGIWEGVAKRKLEDGTWQTGKATRRVSAIVDGLGLLQTTDFSWGEKSISAICFDPQQLRWTEVGTSTNEPDFHWLSGMILKNDLEMNELPSSDNGVAHSWWNMTTDSFTWERKIRNPSGHLATIQVAFKRVDETGRIDTIPKVPKNAQAEIAKVQRLLQQRSIASAEKVLLELTEEFPKHDVANFYLGYIFHTQKRYDEALKAYEISKSSQQVGATTEYNIACIYALKNDVDSAFEHLEAARKAGFTSFAQMLKDRDMRNIRNDPRFETYLKATHVDDDDLFTDSAGNTRIIHSLNGEAVGNQFGWTARRVGDWDDDNVTDFVVTAPTFKNAGKIYVYSGKTGKLLLNVEGKPGERFGNSSVGCGDFNGDGDADLLVGAPNGQKPGNAYVYSQTGERLFHFRGIAAGDQFGYEVSELGDIDGDGHADVLIGATGAAGKQPRSGAVYVYAGKTGKKLFEIQGERTGDSFGNAAACRKNEDGTFTLAIGAQNAGDKQRGRVFVYQIKDGKATQKFVVDGDENSANFGQMFISFPGDLDGDGVDDIFASDFSDKTKAKGGGKVTVFSGKNGSDILTIHGQRAGEGLGTSPSDAGDVNGDGIGDLVVGAWQNNEGAPSAGKVYLFDGKTGKPLRTWICNQSGDTFGFDACGIGDVDGDGAIDFLLTSAWSNVKRKGPKTGRVFVIAGEKYRVR
ncbi:MAG: FG-GAP-like repeat-containing protein [Planctomycetota bacterium]